LTDRRLGVPLGAWSEDIPHDAWQYSSSTNVLIEPVSSGFLIHHPLFSAGCQTRLNARSYSLNGSFRETIPSDCQRATVQRSDNVFLSDGAAPSTVSTTPPPAPTLHHFLASFPADYQWIFRHVTSDDEGLLIADMLARGTCKALADGSYKDGLGTASVVIFSFDSPLRVRTDVTSPGWDLNQNAHRSELAGVYAAVQLVNAIAQYHHVSSGSVEFGCDCTNALSRSFSPDLQVNPTVPHFDLVYAIRRVLLVATLGPNNRKSLRIESMR
jgi:hypothetical protein